MTKIQQPEISGAVAATTMFVEVLVVGIGSLAALVTFLAAIAGPDNASQISPIMGSSITAGLALAFSYALGILVDRGADGLLAKRRRSIRSVYFTSNSSYSAARQHVSGRPDLAARADYARSRMRICRGWILNSPALFGAAIFLIVRFELKNPTTLIACSAAVGALLTFGFYVAWRNITATSYSKIAQQAQVNTVSVPSQNSSEVQVAPQASLAE